MSRRSIALFSVAVSLLTFTSASHAQPHPENFAGCQGGCDGASRDLNMQTENLSRATRNYNRGLSKLQKQDFAKAAQLFEKAAQWVPEKADFSYMAGSSYYFAGDHALAKSHLVNALAVEGDEAIDSGQREIARDILKKIGDD